MKTEKNQRSRSWLFEKTYKINKTQQDRHEKEK